MRSPRERVVHEPGDDIGNRDRVVDEGADAELLLVGHPGCVPHRACVARGEEGLVSRQQPADVGEQIGALR